MPRTDGMPDLWLYVILGWFCSCACDTCAPAAGSAAWSCVRFSSEGFLPAEGGADTCSLPASQPEARAKDLSSLPGELCDACLWLM